ncbi:MAG: protein O-GlcNAc transferase [Oleiphilaceae bacterium]|jgi:protein O-GlcNAc transferase
MKLDTTYITLNNGTKICAPSDKNLMTNYVLEEQGDWFEDEIHFVRAFIKPDMQTLDIGANYGLYSTAIANNLGKKGKLWCFEPTQNTADALRKTIEKNNLDDRIELIQAGLSDHSGQATFFTSLNAELNSLTETSSTSSEKQTIDLLTLDQCLEKYQWQTLDFIKLDAEGEELNILKAGQKTLSDCSPLIMFELKHGTEVNTPLIKAFKDLGYASYHLIPSLNILIPLDPTKPLDSYQLNLFCCKNDTAEKLMAEGFLIKKPTIAALEPSQAYDSFFNEQPFLKDAQKDISQPSDERGLVFQQTLNAYASSRNVELSNIDRFQHLLLAFELAKKFLSAGESKIERLSTLARISYDIGQRGVGNQITTYIIDRYIDKAQVIEALNEPFVPSCKEFETIDTDGKLKNWLLSSAVDQYIRKHAFSCYFTEKKLAPHFNKLKKLGFLKAEMKSRQALLLAR